ncbi:MAG: methyltransferase domain-containing protein [Planctomycetota bacterium]|nr:methyltransferase domain-containing protein [Planctomycetota bacterium]
MGGIKYQDICREVGIDDLVGKSVLELGPGPSCAWALLLACRGAVVTVVDPYPAAWDETYHPIFFSALRQAISDLPGIDVTPISSLLDDREFSQRVIRRHDDPVEQLELRDASFDIVFSNAVGEHFYDCAAAFGQLHRITNTGGWGFHWIDFRDHRDFRSPLEYLLMSDVEFAREFGLRRGEIGNRLRADEMSAIIERAGFEIVRREATILADESYLGHFVPRLRRSTSSPYRNVSDDELQILGELFVLRKP